MSEQQAEPDCAGNAPRKGRHLAGKSRAPDLLAARCAGRAGPLSYTPLLIRGRRGAGAPRRLAGNHETATRFPPDHRPRMPALNGPARDCFAARPCLEVMRRLDRPDGGPRYQPSSSSKHSSPGDARCLDARPNLRRCCARWRPAAAWADAGSAAGSRRRRAVARADRRAGRGRLPGTDRLAGRRRRVLAPRVSRSRRHAPRRGHGPRLSRRHRPEQAHGAHRPVARRAAVCPAHCARIRRDADGAASAEELAGRGVDDLGCRLAGVSAQKHRQRQTAQSTGARDPGG